MTHKFEAGDIVIVVADDPNIRYCTDNDRHLTGGYSPEVQMLEYTGRTTVITEYSDCWDSYHIECDDGEWWWSRDMLEFASLERRDCNSQLLLDLYK